WDLLQELSFFFLAGVIAGRNYKVCERCLEYLWLPALILFLMLLPVGAYYHPGAHWVAAVLSVIALPGLMRATDLSPRGVFDLMGRYSLIIYPPNTIFTGLVKVASFRLGLGHPGYFPLIAVVMTVPAIGGGILLKRRLLPLVPPLDRITT